MGMEIRRVPPNWEHPRDKRGNFIPLIDDDYESVAREWMDNCIQWENGTHPDRIKNPDAEFYWDYSDGTPYKDDYRPRWTVEPTWYQVYETVSMGTPVSPPFSSKVKLVNYLVKHGTFWDQYKGNGGWNRKAAKHIVNAMWVPSMIMTVGDDGQAKCFEPHDMEGEKV